MVARGPRVLVGRSAIQSDETARVEPGEVSLGPPDVTLRFHILVIW